MTVERRRTLVRWGVTIAVVAGVAGLDLWSKRWIEAS